MKAFSRWTGANTLTLALVVLVPALSAGKCVPYDPATDTDASADGPGGPCAQPDEAELSVENKAFAIRCGCRETSGRTCTITAGMSVVWSFADSEEHNVTSVARAFGRSADKLAGTFRHTFPEPGHYPYGCTLHPGEMSGYAIDVEEAPP